MPSRARAQPWVTLGLLAILSLVEGVGCRPGTLSTPGIRSSRRPAQEAKITRSRASEAPAGAMLDALDEELQLNLERLQSDDADTPVYFMAYDLVGLEELWLEAHEGHIVKRHHDKDRTIDVDVRVGERLLDNSHTVDGSYGGNGLGAGVPVAMNDDPMALAQALWLITEQQYRDAVDSYSTAESSEALLTREDAQRHPDFSTEKPLVHLEAPVEMDLEALADVWGSRVEMASAVLAADDKVLEASSIMHALVVNRSFVNSETTKVQGGHTRIRLMLMASGQAEDGMQLQRFHSWEVHAADQLPSEDRVRKVAERLRGELLALMDAPVAEPYTGPAVLEGPAAGVFFHEIFGHRLEGHRQKDDLEGQTFTSMLGKKVLPTFLDVVDDPTITTLAQIPLNGHYFVDDEGVPAKRTVLVNDGKLQRFLLSRSPVNPFAHSNGHGRRERGHQVVARQGNLIVRPSRTVPEGKLRHALIAEAKRQGKPYGLLFKDIQGGYTITDRAGPQAFKVLPLLVYRVWTDGRPDELVRGVDIVGTPLAAFETILAAGDKPGIFNGMCGAESGWVPVSAVSPSLLLRKLEVERASHDRDRPPLLSAPAPVGTAGPVRGAKGSEDAR